MTKDNSEKHYDLYERCELVTPYRPIFLNELHEKMDTLDKLDEAEIIKLAAVDTTAAPKSTPLTVGDVLEGLSHLTTTGVLEVTEIVESLHAELLLRPLGRFNDDNLSRWQSGLTRQAYNGMRYLVRQIGSGVAKTNIKLSRKTLRKYNDKVLPDKLKQVVNVINGMIGDHLVTQKNPLAVPMVIYDRYGQPLGNKVSGRVVLLCHGLCLSYLNWRPCEEDSLGESIALSQPKTTVLYLDYNTGQRISQNGRHLSHLLQQLVAENPDITQIDLVGYSMGGLVARSALFYAQQDRLHWGDRVGNLITLGTPHQGAVLERISYYVLDVIGKVPFAASLSKMGNIRSAGIIDLRHGSIREEDWKYLKERDVLPEEFHYPTRLPRHVRTYFIAGSIVEGVYDSKATNLVGDGLVTIESALGEAGELHTLYVPEGHKAVFYGVNHINIQYDRRVHKQVVQWLDENGQSDLALQLRIQSFIKEDVDEEIEILV